MGCVEVKKMDHMLPDKYYVKFFLGLSYMARNDLSNTLACLQEALEKAMQIDDERTDVYKLRGFCHFKQKAHEKTIDAFQKVLELNPGSAIAYANIASTYRDMGERDKTVQYYKLAPEPDETIAFARENLRKLEAEGTKKSGQRP